MQPFNLILNASDIIYLGLLWIFPILLYFQKSVRVSQKTWISSLLNPYDHQILQLNEKSHKQDFQSGLYLNTIRYLASCNWKSTWSLYMYYQFQKERQSATLYQLIRYISVKLVGWIENFKKPLYKVFISLTPMRETSTCLGFVHFLSNLFEQRQEQLQISDQPIARKIVCFDEI